MKRRIQTICLILIVFLVCFCLAACGGKAETIGKTDSEISFPWADTEAWKQLPTNSPERIAMTAAEIYQDMMNAEMKADDGWKQLRELGSALSKAAMDEQKDDLIRGINSSRDYFEQKGETVSSYAFSECVIDPAYPERVTIYRIQIMSSGKMYYFKQDFIQENDMWVVYGDNVENPFFLIREEK